MLKPNGLKLMPVKRFVLNEKGVVYFLCHNQQIVYIGSTTTTGLHSRIHSHSKDPHKLFCDVFYLETKIDHREAWEYIYISIFSPPLNCRTRPPRRIMDIIESLDTPALPGIDLSEPLWLFDGPEWSKMRSIASAKSNAKAKMFCWETVRAKLASGNWTK